MSCCGTQIWGLVSYMTSRSQFYSWKRKILIILTHNYFLFSDRIIELGGVLIWEHWSSHEAQEWIRWPFLLFFSPIFFASVVYTIMLWVRLLPCATDKTIPFRNTHISKKVSLRSLCSNQTSATPYWTQGRGRCQNSDLLHKKIKYFWIKSSYEQGRTAHRYSPE